MTFLIPAPGRIVRDPATKQPLPETGRDVALTSFWLRRIASGDVLLATPPTTPPSKAKEPSK